ncbi:MAG: hypothetical protein LBQ52_02020 [Helicobacteraceae bacterium]|jgi:hypothetical protein|nr:hypothetical protein [Helicobacteraceae bacterium]
MKKLSATEWIDTYLKELTALTDRSFDKLNAEYPDFAIYTVLIAIDLEKGVSSIGFDDLENSLIICDWLTRKRRSGSKRNENL